MWGSFDGYLSDLLRLYSERKNQVTRQGTSKVVSLIFGSTEAITCLTSWGATAEALSKAAEDAMAAAPGSTFPFMSVCGATVDKSQKVVRLGATPGIMLKVLRTEIGFKAEVNA